MNPSWEGDALAAGELMTQIEKFESDVRNKPVENLGRASAYPRILPLRDVLQAATAEP